MALALFYVRLCMCGGRPSQVSIVDWKRLTEKKEREKRERGWRGLLFVCCFCARPGGLFSCLWLVLAKVFVQEDLRKDV